MGLEALAIAVASVLASGGSSLARLARL